MIGKPIQKLIIVCDEKTREYANYLRQLISVNDDGSEQIVGTADGTVEVGVWSEKEYQDQQKAISSNEHILFVGSNKTSASETKNMVEKFNQYGMKYGWLGKRAMMQVDDPLLSKEEYTKFIEFCAVYKQYFEKLAYQDQAKLSDSEKPASKEPAESADMTEIISPNENDVPAKNNQFFKFVGSARAVIINNVLEPIGAFAKAGAKGAFDGVKAHLVHKKIMDQQYRALTIILYLDGLKEFMEG